MSNSQGQKGNKGRRALDYSAMNLDDISVLDVADLA